MDKSSHYYALLALCRLCGMKKGASVKVAYASQYVDDALINKLIFLDPEKKHTLIKTDDTNTFFGMATCHAYYKIKTFNYYSMVNNTIPFHFIPGLDGDSFIRKLRCKKKSPVIVKILENSLDDDNLIKFGMLLHPYADSYAHQGFSGLLSMVNDIENCQNKSKFYKDLFLLQGIRKLPQFDKNLDRVCPAYGHAQAFTYPDTPYLKWYYEYDESEAFRGKFTKSEQDNVERYKTAFEDMEKYINNFLTKHDKYKDVNAGQDDKKDFYKLLSFECSNRNKIKKWMKFIVEKELFDKKDSNLSYDEYKWLKEAFKDFKKVKYNRRVVENVILKDNFEDSSWYAFYKAVKWYKNEFFKVCDDMNFHISI